MVNKAFCRALHSLLHPISIASIALLIVNDHWLRYANPSWLTGKLGDFTWLVFAPFVCAVLIAWLVPQRINSHQRVVGLLALLIIGLWFALAKTIPLVHILTASTWEGIIGWKGSQRLDPTDLLTLPALLLSWTIWQHSADTPIKASSLAWIPFSLGVVATLASDGGPVYTDAGITVICLKDGVLTTYVPVGAYYDDSYYTQKNPTYKTLYTLNEFSSKDGGLTWVANGSFHSEQPLQSFVQNHYCSGDGTTLKDQHSVTQYRWKPGEAIERSADGGQSWSVDHDLHELRQEVRQAYKPSNEYAMYTEVDTRPGPRSGLIDPNTGNLVLAMGWDGVLIRTVAGKWYWASVSYYQLNDLTDFDRAVGILFFELWEAGALIILVVVTSAAHIRQDGGRNIVVAIGWIGWLCITIFLLLGVRNSPDYVLALGMIALPLLLLALPLLIGALWDLGRNFLYLLWRILGIGTLTAILYLIPLILWTQGTIPRYVTAMGFSMFLTVAALYAGYRYLRPLLPVMKQKRKPKADESHEDTEPEPLAEPTPEESPDLQADPIDIWFTQKL